MTMITVTIRSADLERARWRPAMYRTTLGTTEPRPGVRELTSDLDLTALKIDGWGPNTIADEIRRTRRLPRGTRYSVTSGGVDHELGSVRRLVLI